jgi:hypothetical protein
MKKKKSKDNESKFIWGKCIDCDFEGHVDEFEFDEEYNEFNGHVYKHPYCPKCGGGVELNDVTNIDNT